jgi:hypothetical protein
MGNDTLRVGELEELLENRYDPNGIESGITTVNEISEVGIEVIDKDTKELKEYYVATGAWYNDEKGHLTITVEI